MRNGANVGLERMAIDGKVYIIPNRDRRSWELWVENTGGEKFGVTHNVFASQREVHDCHDDHTSWGHGLPVEPGKATCLEFRENASYHGKPITNQSVIRLGIRQHAYKEVQLPSLDGEQVVELSLRDFHWYAGSAADAHDTTTKGSGNSMEHWGAQASNKMRMNQDRSALASKIASLRKTQKDGIIVHGEVRVTAVPDAHGTISHWTIRFENHGKQAFIGTAAFTGAQDKNDGLGLESMPVPHKGSAAVQRIEAMGNYGVTAAPGATLRLGVRGYGWTEIPLPQGGEVSVPINQFTVESSKRSEDWFDAAKVEEKRNEKLKQVQFFDGDRAINDELKPITYRGDEARARATFDPPHITVIGQPDGWTVEVTSRMPGEDDRGPVGFVTTLKLGRTGFDAQAMPPKKLEAPGETKRWFIPNGLEIDGNQAVPGAELIVGTRGLGWFANLGLPANDDRFDSDQNQDVFGFREDQYNRQNLAPDFLARCKE